MMCQLCGANIRGRGSSETTLVSIVANPVQSPPNFPGGPGKDDKLPDNNEIIGAELMETGAPFCRRWIVVSKSSNGEYMG
ncbi:hypothetical protein F0562_025314 [Nyssa sinensis]|uniref:Uncharacterized protein n=1 Tax=Nyssa sinensis TaxID=561372 RepID=A0A5J5BHU7_9ASTE|nr:hypothetical protein F0562_025314 [Nyssa sinensis]